MSKLWNWLKSLFTGDNIGAIWKLMFTAAKNTVAEMVSDPKNQQKALDLAKELMFKGYDNATKRSRFNEAMKAWAAEVGVSLTEAAINALRENAVVALKCEGCCEA